MAIRFVALALALAIVGSADTLRLRDGSTITGTFMGATADDIRFSVNGEVIHYSRDEVAQINFSSTNASAPSGEPDWVVKGPDYAGAPFLRGATGFIPLERETAMASRSGGMYGIGGPTVYRIQGQRSSVRVNQTDRIVFVVRLDSGRDARQFQLYRLESRMGYRQTQPAAGGPPPSLPLTITQVGDSVYLLTPTRALYPGEYSVSSMNSNDSYCFGVDN